MRLAIVTSHPVQYEATWFRALAAEADLDLDVLFCARAAKREQPAAGFGVDFEPDGRLLDGYAHRFLENRSPSPSASTLAGTNTPELFHLLGAYDAVLVNGWHYWSAWQAIRTCWRRRVPVLVRSDSHLHSRRSPLTRVLKALPHRLFIQRFDACLPVGVWSRDYFLHYGADPHRIFTVPYAVDPSLGVRGMTLRADRATIRARWGLDTTQHVCLFVGAFVAGKRPLDFVAAVARAHAHDRRVAGLMVGDGPIRAECARTAAALGAPIRFTGFLDQGEVASAYAAADVLALPSEAETWALRVDEAMSCGIPCLVSEGVGCGPDLVRCASAGRVFPTGDVKALSQIMVELAANPATVAAMGDRARVRVQGELGRAVGGVKAALAAAVRRAAHQASAPRRSHEVVGHG